MKTVKCAMCNGNGYSANHDYCHVCDSSGLVAIPDTESDSNPAKKADVLSRKQRVEEMTRNLLRAGLFQADVVDAAIKLINEIDEKVK